VVDWDAIEVGTEEAGRSVPESKPLKDEDVESCVALEVLEAEGASGGVAEDSVRHREAWTMLVDAFAGAGPREKFACLRDSGLEGSSELFLLGLPLYVLGFEPKEMEPVRDRFTDSVGADVCEEETEGVRR
jgi:hypothetical protein